MRHSVPTRAPFSFPQSLTFIRRFPPNHGEFIIGRDAITAALSIGNRAVPFTVRSGSSGLEVEAPDDVRRDEIVPRVSAWLGADHDLGAFYTAAESDEHFHP